MPKTNDAAGRSESLLSRNMAALKVLSDIWPTILIAGAVLVWAWKPLMATLDIASRAESAMLSQRIEAVEGEQETSGLRLLRIEQGMELLKVGRAYDDSTITESEKDYWQDKINTGDWDRIALEKRLYGVQF